MNWKKILILFLYIVIACLFVLIIKPPYLFSILIVYLPPSLVNFFWLKKSRRKILIFSALTTILFALPVELSSRLADAWDVQSIFPRLFETAPLENLLFSFFNFFWVLCFYEYFIDKDKDKKISSRWKYLVLIFCLLSLTVYTLYFCNQEIVTIPYWVTGVFILIIPAIIIFSLNPKLLKKIIIPTIFFAFVFLIHEAVSLYLGHWWWPGEYLLPLNINGIIFPLDDVIIWYILSTPALIGGYEFFMDDNK